MGTQAKLVEMSGGGVQFIKGNHTRWGCGTQGGAAWHVAVSSATWHLQQILFDSCICTVFWLGFRGSFWGPFGVQNGSCVVLLEISRSLISNNIKCARIGVWTKKLWLSKVGASELFFCVFSAKIPAKQEMFPANRELHVVVGVAVFLKVLNLRINS